MKGRIRRPLFSRISKIYVVVSKLLAYLLRRPKLLFTNREQERLDTY